jgi:hypothetical protein
MRCTVGVYTRIQNCIHPLNADDDGRKPRAVRVGLVTRIIVEVAAEIRSLARTASDYSDRSEVFQHKTAHDTTAYRKLSSAVK